MKIALFRGFLFVALCMMFSIADAQVDSNRPLPDDDPVVEQSTEHLLSQFDKNADQKFDQQELRSVLGSLLSQIQQLRLEVRTLRQQCELLQSQQSNVQITRKPVLLFPSDGGVYGGKYYPPPAGTNK